jgi:hypothetical protein
MKTLLPALLLALAAALPAPAAPPPDDLWENAVHMASRSRHWVAGEVRTFEHELDRKGAIKNTQEYLSLVRPGPRGELDMEHWRIEKGQRVPFTPDEEDEDDGDASVSFGPLDHEHQHLVAARRLPGRVHADGVACVAYEYEMRSPDDATILRGQVRLDERDGTLREMTLVPDPLPDDVKELNLTYVFRSPDVETLQPLRMTTDVSASVFFLTKKFRIVQEFGSFWSRPEPDAQSTRVEQ